MEQEEGIQSTVMTDFDMGSKNRVQVQNPCVHTSIS